MKVYHIYKAQDVYTGPPGYAPYPSESEVVIEIRKPFPVLQDIEEHQRVMDKEAETLAVALRGALPGGVFDRLVANLMKFKVSDFSVRI